MPLPTSGPIYLSQLYTEFGGVLPCALSHYYKGGARFMANYGGNANVPSSGQISLNNFLGAFACWKSSDAGGSCGSSKGCTATTNSVQVYPATAGYTYSWARISGSAVPTISSTTASSVYWTGSGLFPGNVYSAYWRCTITRTGFTTGYVDVYVEVSNDY